MTIGEKIKHYREKQNFSQKDVGELLDFHANAVSNWERNLSEPNMQTIKLLAKIFKISEQAFFDDRPLYSKEFFQPKTLAELKELTPEELTEFVMETASVDVQCDLAGCMGYQEFSFLSEGERRELVLSAAYQYPEELLEEDILIPLSVEGVQKRKEELIRHHLEELVKVLKKQQGEEENQTKKIESACEVFFDYVSDIAKVQNDFIFLQFMKRLERKEQPNPETKAVRSTSEQEEVQKIIQAVKEELAWIEVTYVSVWDGYSHEVKTNGKYNPHTGEVYSLEAVDGEFLDSLDEEYIVLHDGTEKPVGFEDDGKIYVRPPAVKITGSEEDIKKFLHDYDESSCGDMDISGDLPTELILEPESKADYHWVKERASHYSFVITEEE